MTWLGWASLLLVGFGVGFIVYSTTSTRAFGFFRSRDENAKLRPEIRTLNRDEIKELGLDKYRGPAYPHPIIFPERCIGCQAV